jgi:hypothetical protein
VGNPNRTSPTVWRLAQRQHQAVASSVPQITVHARGKFDWPRWRRRHAGATEPSQVSQIPDPDVLVDHDRKLPYEISAGPLRNGMPGFMMCEYFLRRTPPPPARRRTLESIFSSKDEPERELG